MKAVSPARCLVLIVALSAILPIHSSLAAEKLDKAKSVVDRVRQPDPPQVSTVTKPSPVGQSVREYKPTPPSLKIKEPPSPAVNKLNPRNDSDVQRRYDKHQKEYNKK